MASPLRTNLNAIRLHGDGNIGSVLDEAKRDPITFARLILGQNPWRLQQEILNVCRPKSPDRREVLPCLREDVQRSGGSAMGLGALAGVAGDHDGPDVPSGEGDVG